MKSAFLLYRYHLVVLLFVVPILGIIWPFADVTANERSELCTVNRVIDGDGVRLNCGAGRENLNVRLHCIDAPESDQQPWGDHATRRLRALIGPQVTLRSIEIDRYGRTVGRIYRDGEDLNLRLVREGKAAVYPQFCKDQAYYRAERRAKRDALGIWAEPGMHQEPWQWRRVR